MIIHISYIQHSKRDDESDLPSEPNQGFNNPSKMEIRQVTKKKKMESKKIIGAFFCKAGCWLFSSETKWESSHSYIAERI